jgi:hypothetical protein
MKQHTIEVEIDAEGNVNMEVNGVSGKDCLKATAELEAVLGVVTNRTVKHEMSLPAATGTKTTIKH